MIALSVNGRRHDLDIEADAPLLWALRDELGLTGSLRVVKLNDAVAVGLRDQDG